VKIIKDQKNQIYLINFTVDTTMAARFKTLTIDVPAQAICSTCSNPLEYPVYNETDMSFSCAPCLLINHLIYSDNHKYFLNGRGRMEQILGALIVECPNCEYAGARSGIESHLEKCLLAECIFGCGQMIVDDEQHLIAHVGNCEAFATFAPSEAVDVKKLLIMTKYFFNLDLANKKAHEPIVAKKRIMNYDLAEHFKTHGNYGQMMTMAIPAGGWIVTIDRINGRIHGNDGTCSNVEMKYNEYDRGVNYVEYLLFFEDGNTIPVSKTDQSESYLGLKVATKTGGLVNFGYWKMGHFSGSESVGPGNMRNVQTYLKYDSKRDYDFPLACYRLSLGDVTITATRV
jgi:hypothetical protein